MMTKAQLLDTGNKAVDAVGMMNISGNVIPNAWYSHVLRDNGKPYHFAISLLGEIVYWYKPVEIRDEESGRTVGYRRKFKGDLLQKSYEQLGTKFGEEKQTVKRALDRLEAIGVIQREFRTVTVGKAGTKLNNVMYIALIPEVLQRITYIGTDGNGDPGNNKSVDNSDPAIISDNTLSSDLTRGSEHICMEPLIKSDDTNTKSTAKNTDRDYSHPISLHWEKPLKASGNVVMKSEQMDKIDEINTYRNLVRNNIEYDLLLQEHKYDSQNIAEIYELICDVVCMTNGEVKIAGQPKPYQVVKSVFLKLTRYHIEYVIESLKKTYSDVKNMRAYLMTALYRSVQTYHNSLDQRVRHDMFVYPL